jgi:P-type E1-E2 ATPase
MIEIAIPGHGNYQLAHLVLDVNGTVTVGGQLIEGVRDRLMELSKTSLQVHWITADTRGRQKALDSELGWPAVRLSAEVEQSEAAQKAAFVRSLGSSIVAAIGNGNNDVAMIKEAAIGIGILGPEGLATDVLRVADLIVPDILSALDLFQDTSRLVATLRR